MKDDNSCNHKIHYTFKNFCLSPKNQVCLKCGNKVKLAPEYIFLDVILIASMFIMILFVTGKYRVVIIPLYIFIITFFRFLIRKYGKYISKK